jgi:hypothetical protein
MYNCSIPITNNSTYLATCCPNATLGDNEAFCLVANATILAWCVATNASATVYCTNLDPPPLSTSADVTDPVSAAFSVLPAWALALAAAGATVLLG